MALVIKSWSVKSNPPQGQPHVKVVARESGFWSFIFSLLGIDATTTLQVTGTRIEFEHGSLSGFIRRLTTYEHISSTFYGRHKPWKTALGFLAFSLAIGSAIGDGWAFFAFLVIGLIAAGLYYFLNRKLTIGFNEDSGEVMAITFKRSVIEGQEIDEVQLQKIIEVVEHLIKAGDVRPGSIDMGGSPGNGRMAGPAPTNLHELVKGQPTQDKPPARPVATPAGTCPACTNPTTPEDLFCGSCGHKLK